MSRLFPTFLLLALAACGADAPDEEGLEPGYTECGDTTCAPGQYCFGDGLCQNGCTSDANCLPEDACVIDDDFFNEGTCQPVDGGPVGDDDDDGGGDPLAACQSACEDFQDCGLSPADTSQCIDDCVGLTETQQQVVGNCGGRSCISTLECLGIECFVDDDCSGAQECVGSYCL